jgi:single-strand DNA-binding protein
MSTILLSGQVQSTQLRFTPNNQKPVLDIKLAFNQLQNGESVVRRIKVTAWEDLAKQAAEQFPEDSFVIVQGTLRSEAIERQEGVKQQICTITAYRIFPSAPQANINFVTLAGRTGKDAEARYFESGTIKATSSLAVSRSKDEADWFNLEAWSKTAETLANYASKGSSIGIEGSFRIDVWKDKNDGSDRFRPYILVSGLTLLGKPANKAESNGHEPAVAAAYDYSDIPF